jgi:hypothetical protein
MGVFIVRTRGGVVDSGQDQEIADLVAEIEKRKEDGGSKILLHLHGGLVDEGSGIAIAKRLSGQGSSSFQLDDRWTQIYVIWRTGVLETLQTNWIDLVRDDRLYQTLVRKLILFVVKRIVVPVSVARGAESLEIGETEIQRGITGRNGESPFDALEIAMASSPDAGQRAAYLGEQSAGELARDFQKELAMDDAFQLATADIDEALNAPTGARGTSPGADRDAGSAMLRRLDDSVIATAITAPLDGSARGIISSASILLIFAAKIAAQCFKRFRDGRDHGIHATIVEEVCRKLYGDFVGAKIWGMMTKDAQDHFSANGFGTQLIEIIKGGAPARFVVVAHSAGSILAASLLRAADDATLETKVRLFLLAPAVRADVFADIIDHHNNSVEFCRIVMMTDEAERRDAVLGANRSYIYPSSLLYLVSGMFEEIDSKAYPDAPLLGLQRFSGACFLNEREKTAEETISAFFRGSDCGVILSPSPGLASAISHGSFDDDVLTIATIRSLF